MSTPFLNRRRLVTVSVALTAGLFVFVDRLPPCAAQSTISSPGRMVGGTTTGGLSGASNRNSGMQQSGQLSSSAAINRSNAGFIGASSGDILSRNGQRTGAGGIGGNGLGGLGMGMGMGMGMNGMGMNGMGMGGMGMGGMGGMGRGGMNNGLMNNQNNGRGGRNGRQNLRFPMRVVAPITSTIPVRTDVAVKFESRLKRIPVINKSGAIKVAMEGNTAVLQGTVATDHHRDLAAQLALLEPGISEVRNEITVATPPEMTVPPPVPQP